MHGSHKHCDNGNTFEIKHVDYDNVTMLNSEFIKNLFL